MPQAIERRIISVLHVQRDACLEFAHRVKKYLLKHSYNSTIALSMPTEWVSIKKLEVCSELCEFDKDDITAAIENLIQTDQVNHRPDGLRYKR